MNLLRDVPWYETHIYDAGKQALFFLFLSFLLAFVLTRLYTRLARNYGWGSGSVGGVHLHHAVPGLILVLGAGVLSFTAWGGSPPARDVIAIAFGVGAGLVLDEWALIFYLKDVYWTKEGRSSIDAVIIGSLVAGILLVVSSPFGAARDEFFTGSHKFAFSLILLNFPCALICFLKDKPIAGIVGLVVPLVAFVGAIRLAKPTSPWSRWFYDPARRSARLSRSPARKLERARQRYVSGWHGRLEREIDDLIGGAPTPQAASERRGTKP
jgi:hypothetical protein